MAFKDWGWFPLVAERIATEGWTAVSFNFSRNGVKGNTDRITDFDAFEQNSITREILDLGCILKAIREGEIARGLTDLEKIVLLGHSRGGAVAILSAASDGNIAGLVTWSSVSHFDRWTQHQKSEWRKIGFLPMARNSAVSPLRLGLTLLDDIEQNREALNLLDAARRVTIPWLILHGREDLVVRFAEAEQLYAAADKSTTTLAPLEQVGHTYDGPEVTEGAAIHRVLSETTAWLHKIDKTVLTNIIGVKAL